MLYWGGCLQSESPIGTDSLCSIPAIFLTTNPATIHLKKTASYILHASKDLSYCSENPTPREHKKVHCRHLDATETITVFEKSVLIATRITEYIYIQERIFDVWGGNEEIYRSVRVDS